MESGNGAGSRSCERDRAGAAERLFRSLFGFSGELSRLCAPGASLLSEKECEPDRAEAADEDLLESPEEFEDEDDPLPFDTTDDLPLESLATDELPGLPGWKSQS